MPSLPIRRLAGQAASTVCHCKRSHQAANRAPAMLKAFASAAFEKKWHAIMHSIGGQGRRVDKGRGCHTSFMILASFSLAFSALSTHLQAPIMSCIEVDQKVHR